MVWLNISQQLTIRNSGEETWMEVLKKKSKDKLYYQSKIKIKAIGFLKWKWSSGKCNMCLYEEPPPPTEKRRLYCPSFLFDILIPFATRLVHPFIFESMEVMKKI